MSLHHMSGISWARLALTSGFGAAKHRVSRGYLFEFTKARELVGRTGALRAEVDSTDALSASTLIL
jgi:hypothetical protein